MEEKKGSPNHKLRQAREIRGWTQKDTANSIDLPDIRSLRRWEKGETIPSLRYQAKLREVFEMSPVELGFIPESSEPKVEKGRQLFEMSPSTEAASSIVIDEPPPTSIAAPDASLLPHSRNRQRLLKKVYTFWIKDVLEQSLIQNTHLTLSLQMEFDVIADPWDQVALPSKQSTRPLPSNTSILQVYDDAGGELLILGEPGSGKTTLLLELARDLLQRAFQNEALPIPVIFNLSSWDMKQQSLASWLVAELGRKYQIPQRIGQAWIENEQILPLLDGLDEAHPVMRRSCLKAINAYRAKHGLLPLVVCSRRDEYKSLKTPLMLGRAICIQPLTKQQIDQYLSRDSEQMKAVKFALEHDVSLHSLTITPLILNILTSTYRENGYDYVDARPDKGQQSRLFATYVEQMLKRRKKRSYSFEQSIAWLAYLAYQMRQRSQSDFYLERMQFDWLLSRRSQQLWYGLLVGLWVGLFSAGLLTPIATLLNGPTIGFFIVPPLAVSTGVVAGVAGALLAYFFPRRLPRIGSEIIVSAALVFCIALSGNRSISLTIGLVLSLIILMLNVVRVEIQPTETTAWSWKVMRRNLLPFLLKSSFIGMGVGAIIGVVGWLIGGFTVGLVLFFTCVTIFLLLAGLRSGFSNDQLDERSFDLPNQGIKYSMRSAVWNMLATGLVNGLILVVIGAFVLTIFSRLAIEPFLVYACGFAFLIATTFATSMHRGGETCMKHMLLRFFLWRMGHMPWRYIRFLDYAAECSILRKVGGSYIFVNRAVLEYFAALSTSRETLDEKNRVLR